VTTHADRLGTAAKSARLIPLQAAAGQFRTDNPGNYGSSR
jgi:hypothetical protein